MYRKKASSPETCRWYNGQSTPSECVIFVWDCVVAASQSAFFNLVSIGLCSSVVLPYSETLAKFSCLMNNNQWGHLTSLHFIALTSVWSQHRGLCWGNLSCKFWCLPARHYTAAGEVPVHAPWHLAIHSINECHSFQCRREWLYQRKFSFCLSILPGVFVSFGMMQRTKWGWVLRRLVISLFKFS